MNTYEIISSECDRMTVKGSSEQEVREIWAGADIAQVRLVIETHKSGLSGCGTFSTYVD